MISIKITEAPDWMQAAYGDSQGNVYLDVNEDTSARLTKAVDRQDDESRISQEAALPSSVTATHRNRAILYFFARPTFSNTIAEVKVEMRQNGKVLPVRAISVVSFNPNDNEFELLPYGDDWVDDGEFLKLRDVDLGTFTWNQVNVENAWSGDRKKTAIPMLAHYGGWTSPGTVTLKDLRFVFNLDLLAKAAACAIGWQFESEHYEFGDAAYSYSYLSGQNWSDYTGRRDPFSVELEITTQQVYNQETVQLSMDEVFDPNDLWNVDIYSYPISEFATDMTLNFTGRVRLNGAPPNSLIPVFSLTFVRRRGGLEVAINSFVASGATGTVSNIDIDFSAVDVDAEPGDQYFIRMTYGGNQLPGTGGGVIGFSVLSANATISPYNPGYAEDTDIPLAELIDEELTFSDLLAAMRHLCNGKFETNYQEKKIILRQPSTYISTEGEPVQGFYLNDGRLDLTELTVPDSLAWEDEKSRRDRYIRVDFDNGRDEYLSNLDQKPDFSTRVDLLSGRNKEKPVRNPLFEPTGEVFADGADVGSTGIFIPALWDNTEGSISRDIAPRVVNYFGLVDQPTNHLFEGALQSQVPYFAMIPTQILPGGVAFLPITFRGYDRDLFNLHYRYEIRRRSSSLKYTGLFDGGDEVYDTINFRREILVQSENGTIALVPTAVKDHPYGESVSVLVEFYLPC